MSQRDNWIITYFKLIENQNYSTKDKDKNKIITYFKLIENQNTDNGNITGFEL